MNNLINNNVIMDNMPLSNYTSFNNFKDDIIKAAIKCKKCIIGYSHDGVEISFKCDAHCIEFNEQGISFYSNDSSALEIIVSSDPVSIEYDDTEGDWELKYANGLMNIMII